MGLLDFLKRPGGPPRGWDHLPAPAEAALAIPAQKALTFNGAEYVPPLFHGPGATEAYEAFVEGYAGRVDGNSAVFACLMALSLAYFEAPVKVYRVVSKGNRDPLPTHPLADLLEHPNPWHSARELWFWASWALNVDGNVYLEKVRAGDQTRGNVVQLVPRSPLRIKPITEPGSGNLIDWYKFTYAPGKWEPVPVENMVHLRLGFDDRDHRLGLAPIKRLVRHVCGDDEASLFATTLLGNYGLPGLTVNLPGRVERTVAEEYKERVTAAFGGGNRGKVAVLHDGATMQQFGFSPEQLNLKALHQIPETRIAAVMRCPPAVAGLSVGLEQTSNYASFREVREMFTEGTLAPQWALRDDKLNAQLLPDFDSSGRVVVATDLSAVRALQEDQNALHTRANADLASGGISLNEYRAMLGQDPLTPKIGDCHLIGGRFVPRSEIGKPPEPLALPGEQDDEEEDSRGGLRAVKTLDPDPMPAVVSPIVRPAPVNVYLPDTVKRTVVRKEIHRDAEGRPVGVTEYHAEEAV